MEWLLVLLGYKVRWKLQKFDGVGNRLTMRITVLKELPSIVHHDLVTLIMDHGWQLVSGPYIPYTKKDGKAWSSLVS